MLDEAQFPKLRRFNAFMGFLHLVQAVAILLLSGSFSLPVTISFLHAAPQGGLLESVPSTLVRLAFGPMIAAFLLISAVAHFAVAFPAYKWYVKNLKKGMNYVRWYEYSLSASVMVVLIAMLSGMYDGAALLMAFAATAVMNLCGMAMEIHNQTTQKTNWTTFVIGCIAGVAPWIAIAWYFFGSLASSGGAVPTFVYFILPTLFVFFFTFALNMWLQYRKVGRWGDYLYGERVYILLSLVAKSALAWQVFAGALRPGS